ncbi:hypothetical protein KIN20_025066 [Parelaphostrongylus tenuis]|uniref:Uncharacterized protein n=1 Tax=Parelaphostrongylus tenuis TaxID=148309 RepID=A0AAD5MUL7_PARTN|nr:hypothetical protein KIN20_025066 [Parelaphostrongylus tenuis]
MHPSAENGGGWADQLVMYIFNRSTIRRSHSDSSELDRLSSSSAGRLDSCQEKINGKGVKRYSIRSNLGVGSFPKYKCYSKTPLEKNNGYTFQEEATKATASDTVSSFVHEN